MDLGPAPPGLLVSILREAIVRITIQPPLSRLLGGHHGMSTAAGMLGGVLVGRAVAAERGAALLARTQMDPRRADLHALRALPALGVSHGRDRGEMPAGTLGCHRLPLT